MFIFEKLFEILFTIIPVAILLGILVIFVVAIVIVLSNKEDSTNNESNSSYNTTFQNESYNNEPTYSYDSKYSAWREEELKRQERAIKARERKLDYQTPSVEDRRYGAVRKDRYGNLYTAAGTVIDKAAIELKRQAKKNKK